jgi:hypothetical protein
MVVDACIDLLKILSLKLYNVSHFFVYNFIYGA